MVTTHNLWHPKHQLQRSDSGNHFMPLTEQRQAHLFSIQQSLEYLREHGLVGAARAAADVLLQRYCGCPAARWDVDWWQAVCCQAAVLCRNAGEAWLLLGFCYKERVVVGSHCRLWQC